MALSTQTEIDLPIVQEESLSKQNFDSSMPPWALADTHLSPNLPNPSVIGGVHGKQTDKFKIKVPNINKQIKSDSNTIKRTDWAKILAEEDEHLEKHKKFKMNQAQKPKMETPSFLRKQRPINVKTQNRLNGEQTTEGHTNGNSLHNKVLPNAKNDTFFEHINKIKNIEGKGKFAKNISEKRTASEQHKSIEKTSEDHIELNTLSHTFHGDQTKKEKESESTLDILTASEKHKMTMKNGHAVTNRKNGSIRNDKNAEHDVILNNVKDKSQVNFKQKETSNESTLEIMTGSDKLEKAQSNGGNKSNRISNLTEENIKSSFGSKNISENKLLLHKKENEETKEQDQTSISCAKRNDIKLKTWDWKSKPSPSLDRSKACSCQNLSKDFKSVDDQTDMGQFVNDITRSSSETQMKELGMLCFDKLSPDVKDDLVGRHLSAIHVSRLTTFLSLIKEEVLAESLSSIIPKLPNSLQSTVSKSLLLNKENVIDSDQAESKDIEDINAHEKNGEVEVTSDTEKINENEVVLNELDTSQSQKGLVLDSDSLETAREIESEEDKTESIDEKDESLYQCSSSEASPNVTEDGKYEENTTDFEKPENNKYKNEDNGENQPENYFYEEDTSKDMSLYDATEKEDFNKNIEKETIQNGICEITEVTDIETSDPYIVESEEESWEWEEEEENEYEYFEEDEDEYKVQTFDGSFSVSLKN